MAYSPIFLSSPPPPKRIRHFFIAGKTADRGRGVKLCARQRPAQMDIFLPASALRLVMDDDINEPDNQRQRLLLPFPLELRKSFQFQTTIPVWQGIPAWNQNRSLLCRNSASSDRQSLLPDTIPNANTAQPSSCSSMRSQ